ncbi:OadG-related small transporter subunit [Proteiniphilum sp.]|nr:OadG-related small transporter subunit [Proteiniphilum sp.]MEA4917908.1 OadG-related small transporter subunit [Proteiniphilum sp.]
MSPTVQTALVIAGIGIVGIFIFMAVFYLLILALDKFLPEKEEK